MKRKTSVNRAVCPNCKKEYEMGWHNSWLSSLFGEYPCEKIRHACPCGKVLVISAKRQTKFTTVIDKEQDR